MEHVHLSLSLSLSLSHTHTHTHTHLLKFPFSAVSIALALHKQPVVGVVYNIVLDQMYSARKGAEALLDGKPLRVSKCTGEFMSVGLSDLIQAHCWFCTFDVQVHRVLD